MTSNVGQEFVPRHLAEYTIRNRCDNERKALAINIPHHVDKLVTLFVAPVHARQVVAVNYAACPMTKLSATRPPPRCSFNIFFSAAAKQNSSTSRAAAKKARKLMSQFGVEPDRVTVNSQIDHAIKQGRPGEAIETFEQALDGVSAALQNPGQGMCLSRCP